MIRLEVALLTERFSVRIPFLAWTQTAWMWIRDSYSYDDGAQRCRSNSRSSSASLYAAATASVTCSSIERRYEHSRDKKFIYCHVYNWTYANQHDELRGYIFSRPVR